MIYGEWYGLCDFVVFSVLRYVMSMVVCMCFMFDLIFASSKVLGLCQCMWCSLCCCMLFVSCVWVFVVL